MKLFWNLIWYIHWSVCDFILKRISVCCSFSSFDYRSTVLYSVRVTYNGIFFFVNQNTNNFFWMMRMKIWFFFFSVLICLMWINSLKQCRTVINCRFNRILMHLLRTKHLKYSIWRYQSHLYTKQNETNKHEIKKKILKSELNPIDHLQSVITRFLSWFFFMANVWLYAMRSL